MRIFLRLSDCSFAKPRIADKRACLDNFITTFLRPDVSITIVADNVLDEDLCHRLAELSHNGFVEVQYTRLGNAGAFLHCLDLACAECADDEPVYLCEDDYLHLPDAAKYLAEGLTLADYATLYDCPDKYVNHRDGGPNPLIEHDGEQTIVRRTASTHWKYTNSTTATFAALGKTLRADRAVWEHYSANGVCPQDFQAFRHLATHTPGRTVASCLPGRSTHCESPMITPYVDWAKVTRPDETALAIARLKDTGIATFTNLAERNRGTEATTYEPNQPAPVLVGYGPDLQPLYPPAHYAEVSDYISEILR